jgi:hypothetical protein
VLAHLLLRSRLVPRPIAALAFVGYALLTLGVPLDLLGILDMNEGYGQLLLAPGGLFELVVLPLWLILKGFGPGPEMGADGHAASGHVHGAGRAATATR